MAFSDTWNAAFEADPADVDNISGGAVDIRDFKVAVQERGEIDHSWAGNGDDGKHTQITFVNPISTPGDVANEGMVYTKTVSGKAELFWKDEDGNELQITTVGLFANDPIEAGTLMLFQQTAAPTGWTKETTHNNKGLRVVTGSASSGGTDSFSTTFSAAKTTDAHTLSTAEMPAHTHAMTMHITDSPNNRPGSGKNTQPSSVETTTSTGGGGSHTHTMTMDLQYVDLIIASKD